jgi:signal transduction histidine kinase
MLAATCSLRRSLGDLVADLYPADESRRVIGCVEKLLDRELAAMVASQLRSYDDRLVAQERGSLAARVSAIQTLSTGFAHELRNPVNAARLQLELLERQLHRTGDRDPKLAHAIEAIEHELERLARLLTEFLSFAKPGELALGSHDVREVVRAAVASEQAFAVAGNVTLEQGGHETVEARIDANKLQQAIQNLVRNAIEACPPGGHVTVIVRGDDQQVHIDVDDDGPGIPDAIQRRIYEPFFTTKQTGTGLGLSIVHSIVTLHGGAVEIHSSPRGSRFEIVLPRRT